METITSNTKAIELAGDEIHVYFTSGFPYFWLRNDSGGTVLMSLSPDIEEGGDGVIEVLAGDSAGTMHGFYGTRRDLYLLGSGKVQVMGTHSAHNPFKTAEKGGGENAGNGLLPHSEGLTAYFDYSKNASETDWKDVIGGLSIDSEMTVNSDSVTVTGLYGGAVNLNMSNAFTIYAIFKYIGNSSNWWSVIAEFGTTPQFNLCANGQKIAIGSGATSGAYTSGISALDYHVCTLTFFSGMGILYIDGKQVYYYNSYHSPISSVYVLGRDCNFKMAAFFENVAQSPTLIAENTNYLAGKYEIQV